MAESHTATEVDFEGFPAVRLAAADGIAATFCPKVGMVACSLEHDGEELLGRRGGLARYQESGSTMGIPLLHPWANRLSAWSYQVAGRAVELSPESPNIRRDPNGLPIHGLAAASPYWDVRNLAADDSQAALTAVLDYGAHSELLEGFPFPHTLAITAKVAGAWLTVTTALTPTSEQAVPVSFGYHPYLRLPDVPRADWWIELPAARKLVLDKRMIPTGADEPFTREPGRLGEESFDDGLCALPERPRFTLAGGGRRVTVEFLEGYAFAQVYAPLEDAVMCFEPMTAATNALVAGGPGLRLARLGETFAARFRIGVEPA